MAKERPVYVYHDNGVLEVKRQPDLLYHGSIATTDLRYIYFIVEDVRIKNKHKRRSIRRLTLDSYKKSPETYELEKVPLITEIEQLRIFSLSSVSKGGEILVVVGDHQTRKTEAGAMLFGVAAFYLDTKTGSLTKVDAEQAVSPKSDRAGG